MRHESFKSVKEVLEKQIATKKDNLEYLHNELKEADHKRSVCLIYIEQNLAETNKLQQELEDWNRFHK